LVGPDTRATISEIVAQSHSGISRLRDTPSEAILGKLAVGRKQEYAGLSIAANTFGTLLRKAEHVGVSEEECLGWGEVTKPLVENDLPPSLTSGRVRAVSVVSLLTVIVASFGYLREATLASRFGLSPTMDAYFGAVFIPTMVYMVLVAGMLSPVFIPILLRDANAGPRKLSETFSVITNFVLLFLVAIIGCALITGSKWLPLLFPGFNVATSEVTLRLICIIFPSVLFVALAGIFTAALNAFHKFALAAIAPVLSSVTVIAAALFARGSRAIYVVGFATAVGYVLQLLLLMPAMASLGIRYRPVLKLRHPAIRQLLRLGGPLFLYLVVANASSFLERNLASRLSSGAVSAVTYATRLFAVPSNFLAAPLAIVAYPQFAREALRENWGDLGNQVSRMFRLVLFIFLPVTIWTLLNALPLTRFLYERGHFRFEDSIVTSRVFSLYGIGILPNAIAVILLPCFYAMQDTITPLWAEWVDLIFYVATAIFLMSRFGIAGLAVSRGAQFYLVAAILMFVLYRRRVLQIDADLLGFSCRVGLACLAMAGVNWTSLYLLQGLFDTGHTVLRFGVISVVLMLSAGTFLVIARLLSLDEADQILNAALELLPRSHCEAAH
jgi:putative peptidoglycan lipid II flippase